MTLIILSHKYTLINSVVCSQKEQHSKICIILKLCAEEEQDCSVDSKTEYDMFKYIWVKEEKVIRKWSILVYSVNWCI